MSTDEERNADTGQDRDPANPARTVLDSNRTPHAANADRQAGSDPEVAASEQDWDQVAGEVREAAEHGSRSS
jgi:hypothetical protein